jgi:hypothetical protein
MTNILILGYRNSSSLLKESASALSRPLTFTRASNLVLLLTALSNSLFKLCVKEFLRLGRLKMMMWNEYTSMYCEDN